MYNTGQHFGDHRLPAQNLRLRPSPRGRAPQNPHLFLFFVFFVFSSAAAAGTAERAGERRPHCRGGKAVGKRWQKDSGADAEAHHEANAHHTRRDAVVPLP